MKFHYRIAVHCKYRYDKEFYCVPIYCHQRSAGHPDKVSKLSRVKVIV